MFLMAVPGRFRFKLRSVQSRKTSVTILLIWGHSLEFTAYLSWLWLWHSISLMHAKLQKQSYFLFNCIRKSQASLYKSNRCSYRLFKSTACQFNCLECLDIKLISDIDIFILNVITIMSHNASTSHSSSTWSIRWYFILIFQHPRKEGLMVQCIRFGGFSFLLRFSISALYQCTTFKIISFLWFCLFFLDFGFCLTPLFVCVGLLSWFELYLPHDSINLAHFKIQLINHWPALAYPLLASAFGPFFLCSLFAQTLHMETSFLSKFVNNV